jgi:hypothetical protein
VSSGHKLYTPSKHYGHKHTKEYIVNTGPKHTIPSEQLTHQWEVIPQHKIPVDTIQVDPKTNSF